MKRTNKHNLSDRRIRIIKGNKGLIRPTEKVFHVTELLMPPYARQLFMKKWDDITYDYSDELLTTQGNALHSRYEKFLGVDWECELSLKEEIDGFTIVGTTDGYKEKEELILDIKQTAVWNPSYKKDDFTAQTNSYAWMLRKQGRPVSKIEIDIWYRNWKLRETKWSNDYPKIACETMVLPVWSFEKQEQYIRDQLHYHTMCKDKCNRDDRWQKYAVMKNKNKTSSKNCDTKEQAELWIADYQKEKGVKDKFRVVDTEPTNCLYYCRSRSVCEYAKQ